MTRRFIALGQFERKWRAVLARDVGVKIAWDKRTSNHNSLLQTGPGVADAFAQSLGYQSIGFNWEMLDPEGDADTPRSLLGTMITSLANDLSNPSREWLGQAQARDCAEDFLRAFNRKSMTVFTNHLNGLWWPISDAKDEWTFVAFDEEIIAMMMLSK